jgi:hypothetical protein
MSETRQFIMFLLAVITLIVSFSSWSESMRTRIIVERALPLPDGEERKTGLGGRIVIPRP